MARPVASRARRSSTRPPSERPISALRLRDMTEADLPLSFEWQRDAEANHMAAFTAKDSSDWAAYRAKWTRLLADDTIIKKTILVEGQVVGTIAKFDLQGKPNVTYWIGKEFWGRGFATQALSLFLREVTTRPLYASAAADNVGSLRVLEKCGFRLIGVEKGYANARGQEIDEALMELP